MITRFEEIFKSVGMKKPAFRNLLFVLIAIGVAKTPESIGRRALVRSDAPMLEHSPVIPVEDRIDVTDASDLLLQELPGFHKGIAERVVGYQEQIGDFQTLSALGSIRGMSKARLAEISQYLKPVGSVGGGKTFPSVTVLRL